MYNDQKQNAMDAKEKQARETLCEAMHALIGKSERGEISFVDMRGELNLIITLEQLLNDELSDLLRQ